MISLLVIFAVLSALDAWSTFQGLKLGAKETWIPKYLFKYTGVYWGLLLSKVGIVAFVWWLIYMDQLTLNFMAVVDTGYACLVAWNLYQLHKQKEINK